MQLKTMPFKFLKSYLLKMKDRDRDECADKATKKFRAGKTYSFTSATNLLPFVACFLFIAIHEALTRPNMLHSQQT